MEKICVVGGGIAGVSTAYYLQKSGHDVVLLESKDHLGAGATSIASPVLQKYQSPIIDYPIYDKIKSKFCPVRMFSKSVKMGDVYTHKAFKTAYGYDILKLAFSPSRLSQNAEKLIALTAANYTNTMELIRDEKLAFPMSYGFLRIGDDKARMKQLRLAMRRVNTVLQDNDVLYLTKEEPGRYFPAVQQKKIDLHGGFYDPTAVIFQPSDLVNSLAARIQERNGTSTTQSQNSQDPMQSQQQQPQQQQQLCTVDGQSTVIKPGHVDFRLGTRATGFTLNDDGKIISVETEDDDSIAVDKVVLCNGYAAFQITEDLVEEGPLLHVIPMRSFGYDVLDRTRARDEYTVPTLFPTYPLTFFPADPIYDEMEQQYIKEEEEREALLAQGIYVESKRKPKIPGAIASHSGPEIPPLPQDDILKIDEQLALGPVGAVEFIRIGTILAADPKNSRHVYGYAGKDMAELSGEIDDVHIQGVLSVLEAIRRVPTGALSDPYFLNPENLTDLAGDLRKRYDLEQQRIEGNKQSGLTKVLPFNRPNDHRLPVDSEPVASRHLSMQPRSISLHTVGKDGLPMIGPSHKIPNLLFNTGHGHMPQNTAVIAGKMIADIIHGDETADGDGLMLDTQLHGLKTNDVIRYQDYSPRRFELRPFKTAWFEQSMATRKAAAERAAQEAMLRKHLKLQELKKQKELEEATNEIKE